jgi:endoglucanase
MKHGALWIEVHGGISQPWDAMVGHSGVGLRDGARYTLRFTASASVAADMELAVLREQQPSRPLAEIFRRWPVPLEPAPREFSFSFDSAMTTDYGQVTFRFGGGDASFAAFLDNVSLVPEPAPAPARS